MALAYRKTQSGEWVAYGPAEELQTGEVTVTKKDGTTKTETIVRIGKPFEVDGVQMAYGYLAPRQPEPGAPGTCAECGGPGACRTRYDSNGIRGKVCLRCNREPDYCLSFA